MFYYSNFAIFFLILFLLKNINAFSTGNCGEASGSGEVNGICYYTNIFVGVSCSVACLSVLDHPLPSLSLTKAVGSDAANTDDCVAIFEATLGGTYTDGGLKTGVDCDDIGLGCFANINDEIAYVCTSPETTIVDEFADIDTRDHLQTQLSTSTNNFFRACACVAEGQITQDPIFNGFDGSHFEFQGLPNQFFNLISTKDFQLNAKFIPWNHGAVIGAVGIKVGSDEIYVDLNRTVLINDELIKESIFEEAFQIEIKQEDEIEISAGPFRITIQTVENERLDMKFGVKAKEIDFAVHGVLGQTINNIGGKPKEGKDNMGSRAIEGTYVDYIEEEIFSVGSTFSRFNTDAKRNLDKKSDLTSDEVFTAVFQVRQR